MKLIIRSQYWGNVLKGKPRVDAANPARSFRTISAQAVLTIEGKYWGCCQGEGKRVLEMTEQHFKDIHPGDWDLYHVGSTSTDAQAVHSFFLLPHYQVAIDIAHHTYHNGWQFVGTVPASNMRSSLAEILSDTFKPNETIGFRYHHVHIEILMPHVVDYAARDRKAKAKAEADGDAATTVTSSVEDEKKAKSPIPKVEKSASHDASWATETTASPLTCTSYQEVPKFVPSGAFDQDMICYPVPMPYPVVQPMPGTPPFYPHDPNYAHDPNYPQAYMVPNGMQMVPVHHAGLAPYMQAHAINQMNGWTYPREQPPNEWQQEGGPP
eukprot:scaffold2751_cov131-Cylindrotheca_fusiformis.AAC.30